MNRLNEWTKLGLQYGYIDHNRKYHAPEPEKYAEMLESTSAATKAREHLEYRQKIEEAIEAIKAGTYKNELENEMNSDAVARDW